MKSNELCALDIKFSKDNPFTLPGVQPPGNGAGGDYISAEAVPKALGQDRVDSQNPQALNPVEKMF